MIGSSSGSQSIGFSLRSSVMFFPACHYFFDQSMLLVILLKTDVLSDIAFSKISSYLTISLTSFKKFNKTDSEKNEEILG